MLDYSNIIRDYINWLDEYNQNLTGGYAFNVLSRGNYIDVLNKLNTFELKYQEQLIELSKREPTSGEKAVGIWNPEKSLKLLQKWLDNKIDEKIKYMNNVQLCKNDKSYNLNNELNLSVGTNDEIVFSYKFRDIGFDVVFKYF